MWSFIVGLLAVVALFAAMRAGQRVRSLEREFASLRRQLAELDPDSFTAAVSRVRGGRERSSSEPAINDDATSESTEVEELGNRPTDDALSEVGGSPPDRDEVDGAPAAQVSPSPESPATPRRPVTLEERLGARFFVWVGGIALALAGVFLVKYTVEAGVLTERIRVLLGAGLGLTAIGIGIPLKRRAARVAQSVVAAGVVDLYAVIWASTRLYEQIPDRVGWILMAANTIAAVVLSLRFGPFVAGLGLVGGFSMPLLLELRTVDSGTLFVHFVLLQLAALVISARSNSSALRWVSLAGSCCWMLGWFFGVLDRGATPWLALYALSTALIQTVGARWGTPRTRAVTTCGWIANASTLAVLSGLLAKTDFGAMEWVFLITFTAGSIVLGRFDAAQRALPWIVGISAALLFAGWSSRTAEVSTVAWVLAAFAAIHVLGGHLAGWRSVRSTSWLTLSGLFVVTFGLLGSRALDANWAIIFGLAAAGLCVGSAILLRLRRGYSEGALVVQLSTVGVLAAIALGLASEQYSFTEAWLSVGWLAIGIVLSLLARPLRLPTLTVSGGGFGLLAAVRLVQDPFVHPTDFGTTPVFNALPLLYATVAGGLVIIALRCESEGDESRAGLLLRTMGFVILFGGVAVVHHAFTGSLSPIAPSPLEWSTIVACWVGFAIVGAQFPRFTTAARAIGITALALGVVGPCVLANPLWVAWPVDGVAFFNESLLIYGLPLVMGVIWFIRVWPLPADQRAIVGSILVTLVFVGATVQVRHGFATTPALDGFFGSSAPAGAELYTYSAVWIVLAFAFVGIALWRRAPALRWASLIVMLAATGKIFWIDTGHLAGLYRVASFLGLGVSLLSIGYLYQRWVFRPSVDLER